MDMVLGMECFETYDSRGEGVDIGTRRAFKQRSVNIMVKIIQMYKARLTYVTCQRRL